MRYRVLADCVDLNQKFQKKGNIVSVPDGEPVPKWFEPIGKSTDKAPVDEPVDEPVDDVSDAELSRMTKQELMDTAGKEGVDVPVGATNAEIVRLIRADRKRRKNLATKAGT
jgi:hypothetical protein